MKRAGHILYHFLTGATPFPVPILFPLVLVIWGGVYDPWMAGVILGMITALFAFSFGFLMGKAHQRPKMIGLTVVVGDTPETGLAEHLRSRGVPEEVVQSAREQLKYALVDAARKRETE